MKNRKWGIWCMRSGTSILGHAERWMVHGGRWDDKEDRWDNSKERRWEGTEEEARSKAHDLNTTKSSMNVSYRARYIEVNNA